MQAEIENTHLHEQKLQHELDAKAKSLTSHTLHIISKNKTLEDIQQKLSDLLKDGPTDNRKQLKAVVKMIEHNFVQDKDWDDFRQIFEQVHQEFFQRMQVKAPDLTPADLRLASLIRLNIPSKDISLVLGISPDSLRIARYRLRKKLNLDQGDSLTRFIGSL
jgi:DNA-binding CsgD family transcriptional regulator